MLEHLADGVNLEKHKKGLVIATTRTYADLLSDLLVDDDVHERTRSGNTLVGGDEVLEGQRTDKFLDVWLTPVSLSTSWTMYFSRTNVPSNQFA